MEIDDLTVNTMSIALTDPTVTLAGIRQFGLAPDGSDLRDLAANIAALTARAEQAEQERDDAIERLQDYQSRSITYGGELRAEIERLRAALTTIAERPPQFDAGSMLGQLEVELKRTAAAALATNAIEDGT